MLIINKLNCCYFPEIMHSYLDTQLLRATGKLFEGLKWFRYLFSNEVERKVHIRTNILLKRALEQTGML